MKGLQVAAVATWRYTTARERDGSENASKCHSTDVLTSRRPAPWCVANVSSDWMRRSVC